MKSVRFGASEITILAQLLTAVKDAIEKMEDAQKNNDSERVAIAKREILSFQKQIDELL